MLEETTRTIEIQKLESQAREAYEQKRTKECVSLTKALLLADPSNAEARGLQAAIQLEMQRNLNDARALLDDSRTKGDGHKYRKAAEIILLKTLYLDPEHEEAKKLLSLAKTTPEPREAEPRMAAAAAPAPAPIAPVSRPEPHRREEIPFTAGFSQPKKKVEEKTRLTFPLAVVVIVVIVGVLLLLTGSRPKQNTVAAAATPTEPARPAGSPAPPAFTPSAAPVPVKAPVPEAAAAAPEVKGKVTETAASEVSAATAAVPPAANARVKGMGTLAVSSPTAAEIYMGDKYLGSTPTTLQLPVGRQTLEYRHGDLRTVVTHDVKSNATTTALVTFDITVQINARPWAQVFVDGADRKPLGQTPLSNVRIPIGRVLVFENPNFPAKSHRITEKDSSIQVAFP